MRYVTVLAVFCCLTAVATAQPEMEQRVAAIESRLKKVEAEAVTAAATGSGVFVFLCGVFCALWAQNNGRSAWQWFVCGMFFHVITLVWLLQKNAEDLEKRRQGKADSQKAEPPG